MFEEICPTLVSKNFIGKIKNIQDVVVLVRQREVDLCAYKASLATE